MNITIMIFLLLNAAFILVPVLSTKILFDSSWMSAGKQYYIQCHVIGGRPPPVITWWIETRKLHSFKLSVRYTPSFYTP